MKRVAALPENGRTRPAREAELARPAGLEPATPGLKEQWRVSEPAFIAATCGATHANYPRDLFRFSSCQRRMPYAHVRAHCEQRTVSQLVRIPLRNVLRNIIQSGHEHLVRSEPAALAEKKNVTVLLLVKK